MSQMAREAVEVTYHKLHHCLDAVLKDTPIRGQAAPHIAHGGNPQALKDTPSANRAASLLD